MKENPGALTPEGVAQMDLDGIQKLFTTIVRSERFCEGALAKNIEDGLIDAIFLQLENSFN